MNNDSTNVDVCRDKFRHGDGYAAFYRYWPGKRGAVLYLHGIQSHGAWFEGSAARLAQSGYAVLLPDRRGSGKNTAARGDTPNYRRWIGDVVELAGHLAQRASRSRVHLLGVSWGGKLAAAVARCFPDLFESLTLIAPGICPAVDLPGTVKTHIALAGATGSRRPFAIPLNEPALFTNNPDRQAFIASDIHRLTAVTARFLLHSAMLDRHVRRQDLRFPFPAKLFLAGRERIIDNGRTLALYRSWRAPVKRLTYRQHDAHTLEFEPDPKPFYDELSRWIDEAH